MSPRKSAAPPSNSQPPASTATLDRDDLDPALPPGDDPESDVEKIDFFEYLAQLDDRLRNKGVVYVYRLSPKIKKVGSHAIDKYAARMFSEDTLKEDHGGGRYKLMLDTGIKASNLSRVIEILGTPAKIFPDQILVDDSGNPLPLQPSAAQPASAGTDDGPASRSDLLQILTTVLDRVQTKAVSTTDAVSELASLYKTAAATAVEIGTAGVRQQLSNPQASDNAVLAALRDVLTELKESRKQRDPLTEKIYNLALEKLVNPAPPAAAPDLFDSLKKLQDLTGAEGGGLGLLKNLLGGGGGDSFWEGVGKELFSSLSVAVRDNAPALLQWMREREHFKYVQAMTARQAAGAAQPGVVPPAPAVVVPRPVPVPAAINPPAPQTSAAGAQPAVQSVPGSTAQPPAAEDEMLRMMTFEITSLIKRCWDHARRFGGEPEGESTATVVKLAYPGVLPFIRANFSDLEKLKKLAAEDPVLSAIAADPAFPGFAADFFDELHSVDDGEMTPATA